MNRMTPSDDVARDPRTHSRDATSDARLPALLLTHHVQVLACVARDPAVRMREVAASVGLTERAVLRLVGELEEAGLLRRVREGRCNRYQVSPEPLLKLARAFEALASSAAAASERAGAGVEAPLAPRASSDGISRNLSFID